MKAGDVVRFEFRVEYGDPALQRRSGRGVLVSEASAADLGIGGGWAVRVVSSPNYKEGAMIGVRSANLSQVAL